MFSRFAESPILAQYPLGSDMCWNGLVSTLPRDTSSLSRSEDSFLVLSYKAERSSVVSNKGVGALRIQSPNLVLKISQVTS